MDIKDRQGHIQYSDEYALLRQSVRSLQRQESFVKALIRTLLDEEDLRDQYAYTRAWKVGRKHKTERMDIRDGFTILEILRCYGLGMLSENVEGLVGKDNAEFILFPRVAVILSLQVAI